MAVKKVEVRKGVSWEFVDEDAENRYHSEGMTWYDVGGEFN